MTLIEKEHEIPKKKDVLEHKKLTYSWFVCLFGESMYDVNQTTLVFYWFASLKHPADLYASLQMVMLKGTLQVLASVW